MSKRKRPSLWRRMNTPMSMQQQRYVTVFSLLFLGLSGFLEWGLGLPFPRWKLIPLAAGLVLGYGLVRGQGHGRR